MHFEERIIGQIYDCAVEPDLWPATLTEIRNELGAAYVLIGFVDMRGAAMGGQVTRATHCTEWDQAWLDKLGPLTNLIPGNDKFFAGDIDTTWTQMSQLSESEFRQSQFYSAWVEPQGLRDTLTACLIKRPSLFGHFAAPSPLGRELYSPDDCRIIERLTPHIRRATLISDIVDQGRWAIRLYRKVIDSLSIPVIVTGPGRRLIFANAAGEAILAEGRLMAYSGGAITGRRANGTPPALDEALDRAVKGDVAIGVSGIGVPLVGPDETTAAAYVLPLTGESLRGELGAGYAVVFVAMPGSSQPIATEILRTMFDLTSAEARVAILISEGKGPAEIANELLVSVNTVRTHLARSFSKTGVNDQVALAALVHATVPPIQAK